MRSSKTSGSMVRDPQSGFWQALKLSAAVLGVGLVVMSAGAARAGDDDDEDDGMTFEEKIIDNLMSGIGAKSMEKKGIEYRERSPLVVPPKLDLPPPATEAKAAPNWPKDPEEKRRKEAIAARRKATKETENWQAARQLTPAEMKAGQVAAAPRTSNDPIQPGTNGNPSLSPAELGFSGGLWNMMKGGNATEEKKFTSEPPRQSLVEPPAGYQTPSPNYAYGAGPDKTRRTYFDIMSGKDKEQ
ncbi:hypothetical protein ML401_04680 [Bradyrhizobium sp. 62B]|uniref:hypothetical protein n=1 Tax=unclassified Bradyrhizobium TaxID=2631580 RepID=UPI0018884BDD|nr:MULTISPECIES: hypothetical protein [Bradyrhizobium]WIW47420.1 hypothetical protein ML401_04680 [Bradyrhizobium sp. 62B]MBR0702293.1 hypothetical protein [Bradyrhizobium diazoefficiens]MBR0771048.1 hypothetical protein [Bradyrhizobium diazoefficiens]MBR0929358.1 hypothetical protein [Bradyrhizobium diazoefficiens]MDT4739208.1 hypothetical protein [Bradyrhizobium sp. WYCCWR 12699]